ncbi:MAG: YfcC family protein, partial [Ignavibacteriaceae bacterium]|nr:YfcC family protein [Ignavibacteriaceae bacterium]
MKLSKIKIPNTFTIIFFLLIITAAMTWIIPGGYYQTKMVNGREEVINGTFHFVPSNPQGIAEILKAPIQGFVDASLIIGLVLIVGGAFSVFQKTQAVDSAILGIANAYQNSRAVRIMLIPVFMTIFSLAGAIFGMSEEIIPFILIFVPLALTLGYDTITGVAIPFVAAGAGFAGAFLNPFTVGIAQNIAGLPLFSGMIYRFIVWLITTAVAISFVMFYAKKIKKNPEKSVTYKKDIEKKKNIDLSAVHKFDGLSVRHKVVLFVFLAGLAVLIFGVLKYGWFIEELAAVFLITGIAVGIAGKLSAGEITD